MATALVWLRDDLRVHDNPSLSAGADADRVVPVYVVDPRAIDPSGGSFGLPKIGPSRARFLRESLLDLRGSLRERGGDLVVRRGRPERVLPRLAEAVDAGTVHFQRLPAPDEAGVETAVREAFREHDVDVDVDGPWTHTLHHVDDLATDATAIPDTFTTWRTATEDRPVREQVATPARLSLPAGVDVGEVPTLPELHVDPEEATPDDRAVLPFEGGETAGRDRVAEYVWRRDGLREYKETRNGLLGADYSSKLSPWLAHGCLSPRYVHDEVRRYEEERVANESTYWLLFELRWRDFFQFQFLRHGAAFFRRGGIRDADRTWSGGEDRFERWAAGATGVPFVDANMRELNGTGYVSNRGRQVVASFLADWLDVDWRRGAAYFEARLVDYDVCSNWGNWAYQAGVGNDSRNLYFNVTKQAAEYDPDGAYVRRWLPELASLPDDTIHAPWASSADDLAAAGVRLGEDYPEPVVDVDERHAELRAERL
jgi:deoxyribodipyrimidine photo-lyase